jgi:hypothetical protein
MFRRLRDNLDLHLVWSVPHNWLYRKLHQLFQTRTWSESSARDTSRICLPGKLLRLKHSSRSLTSSQAPLLSCLCLCFRNPGYAAKSPEEQAVLTEQWNATPFFTRIGRWLKWGFRFKYPPFLGDAPSRRANWGAGGKGINTNADGRGARIVQRETEVAPVAEMEHTNRSEIHSPEVAYGGGDQKGFHVSSV